MTFQKKKTNPKPTKQTKNPNNKPTTRKCKYSDPWKTGMFVDFFFPIFSCI